MLIQEGNCAEIQLVSIFLLKNCVMSWGIRTLRQARIEYIVYEKRYLERTIKVLGKYWECTRRSRVSTVKVLGNNVNIPEGNRKVLGKHGIVLGKDW